MMAFLDFMFRDLWHFIGVIVVMTLVADMTGHFIQLWRCK